MRWIDGVLDGLGLSRAGFCGHSYGAWITLHYAQSRPGRVHRLMLLDPTMTFGSLAPAYLFLSVPSLLRRSRKRMTSLCFFFCSSSRYLWAPICTKFRVSQCFEDFEGGRLRRGDSGRRDRLSRWLTVAPRRVVRTYLVGIWRVEVVSLLLVVRSRSDLLSRRS